MLDRTSVGLSPAVAYADPLYAAATPIAYEQPIISAAPIVESVPLVQPVAPVQQTLAMPPQMPAPMPSQPLVTPIYDDDCMGGRSLYGLGVNYQGQLPANPLVGSFSNYGVGANPLLVSRNQALGVNPLLAGIALGNPVLITGPGVNPLAGNGLLGNGVSALGNGLNGVGSSLVNGLGNGVNAVGDGLNAVGNGIVDGAKQIGNSAQNLVNKVF